MCCRGTPVDDAPQRRMYPRPLQVDRVLTGARTYSCTPCTPCTCPLGMRDVAMRNSHCYPPPFPTAKGAREPLYPDSNRRRRLVVTGRTHCRKVPGRVPDLCRNSCGMRNRQHGAQLSMPIAIVIASATVHPRRLASPQHLDSISCLVTTPSIFTPSPTPSMFAGSCHEPESGPLPPDGYRQAHGA